MEDLFLITCMYACMYVSLNGCVHVNADACIVQKVCVAEAGVKLSCKLPFGRWKPNLGPLQNPQLLLSAKLSLQPSNTSAPLSLNPSKQAHSRRSIGI